MLALYRSLLRLYPAEYFREYGAEMTWVFAHANEAERGKKLPARIPFYTRELSGVIGGALRQRLFGDWDWNASRRPDMEFRFPRSTVVLMWVILAGVLMAIAEAKKIGLAYGPNETKSLWSMLPWFPLWTLMAICLAVAVTWAILYALRCTGVHRMEKLDASSGN